MVTQICKLTFPDGQEVTGAVSVATPYDEETVAYSGAVHKLPRRFTTAAPPLLRLLFRNIAKETGAMLAEKSRGCYECEE